MQSLPLPPRLGRKREPAYDIRKHQPDDTGLFDCFVFTSQGARISAKWLPAVESLEPGWLLYHGPAANPPTEFASVRDYPRWIPKKEL